MFWSGRKQVKGSILDILNSWNFKSKVQLYNLLCGSIVQLQSGGGKVKGVNDLEVPLMTYNSLNGNSLSIKIPQDGRL